MEIRTRLPQTSQPQRDSRSSIPCQFFAQGRCRNGSTCPYSHVQEDQKLVDAGIGARGASDSNRVTSPVDLRSQITCQFFQRGACTKGEKCPFAHTVSENVTEPVLEPQEESARPENWHRELRGALVKFEDGAVIDKVNFPSDFSAVRISHLPQDTTPGSVVNLLASLGFVVPEECVRIPLAAPDDSTYRNADIRVQDPQFAKRLCGLPAIKRKDILDVVPISASMPQATNNRRVDSKKVYCSWHKPTKTVWMNFGNQDVAAKVGSKFSAGIYKVLGQRVQCEGPTRGAGKWNRLAWTIRLSDVPKPATKDQITSDIPPATTPRHIEISPPSYNVSLPVANTLIESLLLQAGPLEWWEGSVETNGKRFKAKARFMNEADARQAVKLYNEKPLTFTSGNKLTVQLVHSARFKVSTRIYDAVERELTNHKRVWTSQHLVFMAYPPAQGLRVLKIEGEISKDVASAKATLENVLNGEVMMKDGKPLWASSFATNGHAYQKMKQLERELGIVIIRDKRKSQLRLLGSQSRCKEARPALLELAREDSSSVFTIELDAQQFSWAFKGGYRAVSEAIGDDKVILDIVSNPRRILVAGSEADFNTAQEILRGGQQTSKAEKPEASSMTDCPICWTEAENPVCMPCKHVYCAGCFEDLCLAKVESTAGIRCQGDVGKCNERIPLTELQAHLSSAALEDILEAGFTAHITRHPGALRYCPTPDCGQIYRAADTSSTSSGHEMLIPLFTCPSCMVAVCTACHVLHENMTCADYREHASGGYKALEAAKKAYDIKNCPKCHTMIQKSYGCNHMTCGVCETHICWVCLQTFPTGDAVYSHMGREHSDFGI